MPDDEKKKLDGDFHRAFDTGVWRSLRGECSEFNRVALGEIEVSKQAMITIGMAVREIGRHYLLDDPRELSRHLWKSIYVVGGDLVFLFEMPELEAEMQVVVPEGQWKYRREAMGPIQ